MKHTIKESTTSIFFGDKKHLYPTKQLEFKKGSLSFTWVGYGEKSWSIVKNKLETLNNFSEEELSFKFDSQKEKNCIIFTSEKEGSIIEAAEFLFNSNFFSKQTYDKFLLTFPEKKVHQISNHG